MNISGTVNTYAAVTSVSSCSIQVSDASSFSTGDRVVIIQMKGATIDTTNSANFGDLLNLNNCGNYEFSHVSSVSGTTVFLTAPLQRSYDVSGVVQLIKVLQYNGNVNISGSVTCANWNGSTGGVVIIECTGTLEFNSDIDVKGKGFRFGNYSPTGGLCPSVYDYFYPSTSFLGGEKGESVSIVDPSKQNGRGKLANGGGGGNDANSGGAGGANFGSGGNGGYAAVGGSCLTPVDVGGLGGQSLSYSNLLNKVFLGGGGGGGQQDQVQGTPGTSGGGLVILSANSIVGNGYSINLSAFDALPSCGDGSGGGGAGGTALLDIPNFSGSLNINAKGGNGAVTSCHSQGASGGGGGGCVWSTLPLPINVTYDVTGGIRGIHGNGSTDGLAGGTLNGLTLIGTPFSYNPLPITVSPNDSICLGSNTTLNVSPNGSGYSFSWSPANSLNDSAAFNPTASPSVNTAYIITLVDSNGCQTSDTTTIFINPTPVANFGNTAVCNGNVTEFSDSSTTSSGTINTWSWDFGDGSPLDTTQNPSHIYSLSGNDTATLIISNNYGCKDTISKAILVFYNPLAGFTYSNVCFGDSMAFTDTSSVVAPATIVSYLWTFGDNGATSSIQNPAHLYSSAGTYSVTLTVKTSDSCTNTASSTVTVFDAPQSNFSFNNSCMLDSVVLTNSSLNPVTGTISSWAWDFGDGSPTDTITWSPQHAYSNAGNYTVSLITYSSNLGCADTLKDTITIFSLPVANFNFDTVCLNDSTFFIDLSTLSNDSITGWIWNFGDGTPANVNKNPSHLYATCGAFNTTLVAVSSNGCRDTISKTVTVHCLPPVDAGINDSVCFMENDTLMVTPNGIGYSYAWDSPSALSFSTIYNPVVSPANTTTYTVTLTDNNTCSAIDSVTIFADQQILLTKQVSNINCFNACDGQISITASGGNTPFQYAWSGTCTTNICSGLCEGTHSVTVTDAWGCSEYTDTSLSEPPALIAFINNSTPTSCSNSCDANATISVLGGTPGTGYTYTWNSTPTQNTANADSLCAGTYICSVMDSNSCIAADTVVITSPAAITLSIVTSPSDCNDSTGAATVSATGGTPGYTYSWSAGGQTGQTANQLAANSYTVTATDTNGCTQSQTTIVNTVAGPIVIATASGNNIIAGNTTLLNTTGNGSFFWSPNTTLNCDTCQSPTANPLETTSYCVVVTDTNNCIDSACITILVEYPCDLTVPNAFSPNNDGHNDLLVLHGWDKCVSDFSLRIFNRWGEKVFESNTPLKTWDGNSKNEKTINSAVFVYYIRATLNSGEIITRQGNISLIK